MSTEITLDTRGYQDDFSENETPDCHFFIERRKGMWQESGADYTWLNPVQYQNLHAKNIEQCWHERHAKGDGSFTNTKPSIAYISREDVKKAWREVTRDEARTYATRRYCELLEEQKNRQNQDK